MLISLALLACSGDEPGTLDTSDPTTTDDPMTEPTGDTAATTAGPITCADVERANCVEIKGGDSKALQNAANTIDDDTALVLGEGTFVLDNAVTLRIDSLTLIGQGKDVSVLDFTGVKQQVNGVDIVGDDVHVEGFTVLNAKKDGVRIEESDGVVIRAVKVTWTNESDPKSGAYGLYPVRVSRVLMEDSEAYNAADAGIYVGQCQHAVIRNNIAKGNVAGIEIENTQYADVYGNLAEDNTGGLVVFDLPGNPIAGRDVRIHDNQIINNNRANFAPGGTVALIPRGTGTFAMASRRVEIDNNTYANNLTVDIALLSGFVVEDDLGRWFTPFNEVVGDYKDLDLLDQDAKGIFNFRSYDIYIHDNTHDDQSGTFPDGSNLDGLGLLLSLIFFDPQSSSTQVPTVTYDTIGESAFDASKASGNSNDNRICVSDDPGVSMASINLLAQLSSPDPAGVYEPDAPFAPFDCKGPSVVAPTLDAQ